MSCQSKNISERDNKREKINIKIGKSVLRSPIEINKIPQRKHRFSFLHNLHFFYADDIYCASFILHKIELLPVPSPFILNLKQKN